MCDLAPCTADLRPRLRLRGELRADTHHIGHQHRRLNERLLPFGVTPHAAMAAKSSSARSKSPSATNRERAHAIPSAHACATLTLRVSTHLVHERVFQWPRLRLMRLRLRLRLWRQGREARSCHGPWVIGRYPRLSPGLKL